MGVLESCEYCVSPTNKPPPIKSGRYKEQQPVPKSNKKLKSPIERVRSPNDDALILISDDSDDSDQDIVRKK